MSYTQRIVLFDGTSGTSSTFTSSWVLAADFFQMAVSYYSSDAAASTVTLQGSNDDGLTAAITNTSTLTALTAPGMFVIDPGMRWLRAQRNSSDSLGKLYLQGAAC